MKIFNLSVGTMIMRLHMMCAIMVTMGFFGMMYAGIIVGMVIFLTTLMGIKGRYLNPFRHVHEKPVNWQGHHHYQRHRHAH